VLHAVIRDCAITPGMVPVPTQEHIMNCSNKPICLVLALIASALFNHANAAEPPLGTAPQTVVDYTDLNLNSRAGAAALYSRITRAADRVCPLSGPVTLLAEATRKNCRARAIRESVATVNAHELTRIYAVKTGQSIDAFERVANDK
jgi:UrcA family protein